MKGLKHNLAQERVAGDVSDEGLGCQALVIGGVPRVHLDAWVHNGYPILLVVVQLLHKGLNSHTAFSSFPPCQAELQVRHDQLEVVHLLDKPCMWVI